jgi:hypothetical protein
LRNAATLANQVAALDAAGDAQARTAASGLYHVTTAIAMAWEAAQCKSARRLALAQAVLQHRVLPRDPLALSRDDDVPLTLLEPIS